MVTGQPPFGDGESDRHVAVVPARVHSAGQLRNEVHAARLGDWEAVQVRTHEEAVTVLPEISDDTGRRDAGSRGHSERREVSRDDVRRAGLAKGELRMPVEVAAGLDDLVELWLGKVGQKSVETIRAGRHVAILQKLAAES